MIRRALGHTGLEVSLLALGTVKFGRNSDVKYPEPFALPDDQTVIALLDCAADLGINLIDTAPAYGSSESRLGQLLPHSRGTFMIATKVGETFDGEISHFNYSADHTKASIHRSLEALGRTQLDIVCIHSDGNDRHILQSEAVLETLRGLKTQGVVKAIGLSAKSPDGVLAAMEYDLDLVMATINPNYRDEIPAIAEASNAGLGVLVKKAMQSGHGGGDALSWVAKQRGVSSVVTGTINAQHLRDNAQVVAGLVP